MTLEDVRVNIDRVDGQIKELFKERMQLAEQVAIVKAETADSIYKPEREEIIISRQTRDVDESIVKEYTALIKKVMGVSRMYQYKKTLELRDCFPFECENVLPEHNRLKIMFTCINKSGSLANVLSMIADYGVNVTEIYSKRVGTSDSVDYEFYVELDMNMLSKEGRALIYQLSEETEQFKLLESYRV